MMARPIQAKNKFALSLFGAFHLQVEAEAEKKTIHLPRRKVEALIAYLVLYPGPIGHSREKLAALFWGDTPDAQARMSLRTSLAVLRKSLGDEALITDRDHIRISVGKPEQTDTLLSALKEWNK